MARPYVSGRAGRLPWLMQRISAVLLIVLAFGHFFIQHFTSDAVSTGLTVAARMDNRLWQAYYVMFICLALYHGVNGLIGIINDYCPPRAWRNALNVVLWSVTAFFLSIAVVNIAHAPRLGDVKDWYAGQGFSAGESAGNPPTFAVRYDFRDPMRELHLMAYYLEHHTHGFDAKDLGTVFAADQGTDTAASSAALVAWCKAHIEQGLPKIEDRDRGKIFSSTYEFAVWALNVRRENAKARGEPTTLEALPDYHAAKLH